MPRSSWRRLAVSSIVICTAIAICPLVSAVELIRLDAQNWDASVPEGKEVDCIYGDLVLRNAQLVAVIADAVAGRNANMTVRNVGGSVIDLTVCDVQSDQLSAYYPLGSRYQLTGPLAADGSALSVTQPITGGTLSLTYRGPAADKQSTAEVIYTLDDNSRWLKIVTRVTNTGAEPLDLNLTDAVRADGEFEFSVTPDLGLFTRLRPSLASGLRRRGARPGVDVRGREAEEGRSSRSQVRFPRRQNQHRLLRRKRGSGSVSVSGGRLDRSLGAGARAAKRVARQHRTASPRSRRSGRCGRRQPANRRRRLRWPTAVPTLMAA